MAEQKQMIISVLLFTIQTSCESVLIYKIKTDGKSDKNKKIKVWIREKQEMTQRKQRLILLTGSITN